VFHEINFCTKFENDRIFSDTFGYVKIMFTGMDLQNFSTCNSPHSKFHQYFVKPALFRDIQNAKKLPDNLQSCEFREIWQQVIGGRP
jgi:hypothetical protein